MLLKNTSNFLSSLLFFSFTFILLFIFYYPTGGIDINHFHNDDYLLVSKIADIDSIDQLFQFLFSFDIYKIRPVARFIYFFEFKMFQFEYSYYILFNFFLFSIFISLLIKFFFQDLNILIKVLIAAIAVTSKFFVYHFWNILGSFEIFSLIIFIFILKIVSNSSKNHHSNNLFLVLFSIILILTNERFLLCILFLPFVKCTFHQKPFYSELLKINSYIVSTAILGFYILIRTLLEIPIFVGTQTSDIVKDFNFQLFLYHFISSFFEVFGFSTLPTYLSGYKEFFNIPFSQWKNSYIWMNFIFFLIFLFNIYIAFFSRKKIISYLIFLFLILVSASVTFRLEMRWLSPAFVLILIFYSFALSSFFKQNKHLTVNKNPGIVSGFLIYCFLFLILVNNIYYVKNYRNSLYFGGYFNNQTIINKKY